jgi:hypothetical protein
MRAIRDAHKILVGKPEWKRPLRRIRRRWQTRESRVLLEKLRVRSSSQEFPAFYGTRKFITVSDFCEHGFTEVRYRSLSWSRLIQSTNYFLKTHFNIILHLRAVLPSGLFRSSFSTNILYEFLISSKRAACPDHLIFPDIITPSNIWRRLQTVELLIM